MGCTQSKIENEETVTRCKERKQFMKQAVSARNAFAAAHSAYAVSLRSTGGALSDYAHGEVQFPSSAAAASASVAGGSSSLLTPPYDFPSPPPPPPLPFAPSPLQRAATMPEISIPRPDVKHTDTIIEENEDETETESTHSLRQRSSKGGSSSTGNRSGSRREPVEDEALPVPPPLPRTPPPPKNDPPPPPPPENKGMSWDFFFPSMENVPGTTLTEVDESRDMREEMERKMLEERAKRTEVEDNDGGDGGAGKRNWKAEVAEEVEKAPELPPQPPPQAAPKVIKRVKNAAPVEGKRKGGQTVNLLQVFTELDDCFLKASESAHEVSKMLEAHRLHYHSNFADNRGHIDHSKRVMRVITWNRSFRGLQNADDDKDDFDSEENETHATVLDKLLAWEKKLYDEVKAGEQMKLEYQRKVASLNKLKSRGSNTDALERMKATVSHLHTRYIVDMQSMDSTVTEINRLRDEQLYPKLVSLVDGMATMWENMRIHHENQYRIAEALKSIDISQSPKETSDHHHERTYQLLSVVQEWHSQFDKLMAHQKEYIRALNSWLKQNIIPIDTNIREKVSSPVRIVSPPIQALLHAWHDNIERLRDEDAKTAIDRFGAGVSTIFQYQLEEMKLREKCEETRKELTRKTRQFEDWYNKYMQRRTPPDEMDPERAQDKDLVTDKQVQVEVLKKRLEEEENVYRKQCIQVREKSLTTLRTCLPVLFQAMSEFSLACADMYSNLRNISNQR